MLDQTLHDDSSLVFCQKTPCDPYKNCSANGLQQEQFQHNLDMGVLRLQLQQTVVTAMPNSGTKLQQPGLNKANKSKRTGPVHGMVLVDAGVC